jgi:sporulation protein YlmC with PRC-barrel domain
MSRFLATAAVSLLLGLAPALAETQAPVTASDANSVLPSAQPAASEQVTPGTLQSSETPNSPAPDQSAAGPSAAAVPERSPFLVKQNTSDLLIGNLIGETVVTSNNESIGEITDLVTNEHGRVVAVLVGAGGFLGIDQKDVAIRFDDIKVSRDENNNLTVAANVTKEMIAAAPDYKTLDDQQIIMGEKSDREDSSQ